MLTHGLAQEQRLHHMSILYSVRKTFCIDQYLCRQDSKDAASVRAILSFSCVRLRIYTSKHRLQSGSLK